jgi:hypothetical protein
MRWNEVGRLPLAGLRRTSHTLTRRYCPCGCGKSRVVRGYATRIMRKANRQSDEA